MKALVLNCTLKPSPLPSNTEALATEVVHALEKLGAKTKMIRVADYDVKTGSKSDMGEGDGWPAILKELLAADILIMATPTWMGTLSSIAMRVMERINGLYPVKDEEGRPVTYNKVAGFVVTGEEDGARHVVTEIAGGLMDVGFTIAPQSYTYWNNGPGPGKAYLDSDFRKDWSKQTGKLVAANVVAVAKALKKTPIPA
ncbi:flavodoxin family protein [Mucilaginibacter ginsenosidivorax]|uniref:Flavodoxin family protein n=1 Tax=Mucilaginibacter ginsenosidivorax TaxID=862126 RepID=A0A5B8W290_9SPHI|nr:flavodoxin family protein [Mucilaginibacter ginsenosidivorax]QEC77085.1 flavodoxin family protein [Mucilaginibacter ginsenosidivorax]